MKTVFDLKPESGNAAGLPVSTSLSVVMPAYNEASNLGRVLERLQESIKGCAEIKNYEVIIVDDHSKDGTFELIKSLKNPQIHCVRLSRRSGSHTALRAGLRQSTGDLVLCLSADGQDDPGILAEMTAKVRSGNHIVWGVRRKREEAFLSSFFAKMAYLLIRFLTDSELSSRELSNADFFMMSRKVADAINQCKERHTSLFGLILWLGFKQDFVEYERKERLAGQSKWNFRSRLRLFKDWVIAFSGIPLKLISVIGVVTATLGFLYALFIAVYALLGYARPGWAETAILVLVLGGTQMIMLGIVGEYLWRAIDETRNRPLFFIEEEV